MQEDKKEHRGMEEEIFVRKGVYQQAIYFKNSGRAWPELLFGEDYNS